MVQASTLLKPQLEPLYVTQWRTSLSDPSTQQQFLKMLSKVHVFSQLSEASLLAVCKNLQPQEYQAGQHVFKKGDEADWFGLVLSGRVECFLDPAESPSNQMRQPIKTKDVAAGGTVGTAGLFGIEKMRSLTVSAAVQSTVLILTGPDFRAAMSFSGDPRDSMLADSIRRMEESKIQDVHAFCRLRCFSKLGFTKDLVSVLHEHVEKRILFPGHVLMREGGHGNEMYIVESGRLKIEQGSKVLSILSDGAVLGELAVLGSDKRRRATATCIDMCLITVVHADVLAQMIEDFPHCIHAFHHAYVTTLVGDWLKNSKDEMKQSDKFYGRVHPLAIEEMINNGFGGNALAQIHTSRTRHISKDVSSRPSTARKWVPTKMPSRPSSALGTTRPVSPCLMERRCVSAGYDRLDSRILALETGQQVTKPFPVLPQRPSTAGPRDRQVTVPRPPQTGRPTRPTSASLGGRPHAPSADYF